MEYSLDFELCSKIEQILLGFAFLFIDQYPDEVKAHFRDLLNSIGNYSSE